MRFGIAVLASALVFGIAGAQEFGYSVTSNGNDHLWRINLSTGAATDLGAITFGDAEALSFGPSDKLYAAGGSFNELWDITTPPGTLIGSTGSFSGLDGGMDFHNGTMFYVNGASGSTTLFTLNLSTGASSIIGVGNVYSDNIAINSAGVAYATDWLTTDSLYTVDLTTGAFTLVGATGQGPQAFQVGSDFSASGLLYNLTDDGRLWTMNTATGAASLVAQVKDAAGANLTGFEGLAINTQPVPEPATMAALGLGVLALARRRRKNN